MQKRHQQVRGTSGEGFAPALSRVHSEDDRDNESIGEQYQQEGDQ